MKAAGTDKLKGEMYSSMAESGLLVESLTRAYNEVRDRTEIWRNGKVLGETEVTSGIK